MKAGKGEGRPEEPKTASRPPRIAYGSPGEKLLLVGTYLSAAAASAAILSLQDLLLPPYLLLPAYLGLSGLLLLAFPLDRLGASGAWEAAYRNLPALVMMGAIFWVYSFTFPPQPSSAIPDKVFHGLEFFGLGFFMMRLVEPRPGPAGRGIPRSLLLAFLLAVGYGILDEVHQAFVPGREPSIADLLADALGSVAGVLAYVLLAGRRSPRGGRGPARAGAPRRSPPSTAPAEQGTRPAERSSRDAPPEARSGRKGP